MCGHSCWWQPLMASRQLKSTTPTSIYIQRPSTAIWTRTATLFQVWATRGTAFSGPGKSTLDCEVSAGRYRTCLRDSGLRQAVQLLQEVLYERTRDPRERR